MPPRRLCRLLSGAGSHLDADHRAPGHTGAAEEFLRPALSGSRIGCLAVTEPDAGSEVSGIRTTARRDGGDWALNGSKMYITNGGIADLGVVAAKSDTGAAHASISLFLVDQAMQFHGGYGYMEECPIARYFRDVRLYAIGGGASEIMRRIIAKRLFEELT